MGQFSVEKLVAPGQFSVEINTMMLLGFAGLVYAGYWPTEEPPRRRHKGPTGLGRDIARGFARVSSGQERRR